MTTKFKLFSGLLIIGLIFSLTVYCYGITNQLQQVKSENKLVVAALSQAQTDLTMLRTQYLHIQEEVTHVAIQKQQLEQRTTALQDFLVQSQNQTPCSTVNVPNDVTQRLRERTAEVNAAATDASKLTSALSGS